MSEEMSAMDRRILRWEKKLLLYGRTDRGDYIMHMLNLLRARRLREHSAPSGCACGGRLAHKWGCVDAPPTEPTEPDYREAD